MESLSATVFPSLDEPVIGGVDGPEEVNGETEIVIKALGVQGATKSFECGLWLTDALESRADQL